MSISKKHQPAKNSYIVSFTYESQYAKNVQVLGDFNAWDADTKSMKSSKGKFTFEIELPAGNSFQYRYLIDGQAWDNDNAADYYVDSPFSGIQNSVVVLEAVTTKSSTPKAKATPAKTTGKKVVEKKTVVAKEPVKTVVKAASATKVAPAKAKVSDKKVTEKKAVTTKASVENTPKKVATTIVSPAKKVEKTKVGKDAKSNKSK